MRARPALALALLVTPLAWASTSSVEVDADAVARRLHARLPACVPDGLFEAQRVDGGWIYRSTLDFNKARVDELRVRLEPASALRTTVTVAVVRKEGGMIFDSEQVLAPESAVWAERIGQLAQERIAGLDCSEEKDGSHGDG